MKLYAGNLPFNITEEELKNAFAHYGDVTEASLITDSFSGQLKGFGFVEMPTQAEAEEAIKGLDGSLLKDRNIKVSLAKPKEKRSKRRPRY